MNDFLRQIPLFSGLDDYALERLVAMSAEISLQPGELLIREGENGDTMYIILDGSLQIRKRARDGEIVLAERGAGEVIGEMSVLDQAPRVASVIALTPVHALAIDQETFMALLDWSPTAARAILRTFAQRIRSTQAALQQREKMASLGTLAAGIAHELNNPAAAVKRSAAQLDEDLRRVEQLTMQLDNLEVTPAQRAALKNLRAQVDQNAQTAQKLDAITRSDYESEIQVWLDAHHIAEAWEVAPRLVALGFTREKLETWDAIFAERLPLVVEWAAARGSGIALLAEIADSAERISNIVKAVKEYSYLDRAPLQKVDAHEGLENTLIILRHKWKQGITIQRNYQRDLPKLEAYASDLNQVWTNIIDNAIDAMQGHGELTLCTYAEPDHVCVEICDNGPGIPPETLPRVFDAFFTTKPVGQGTGLGLHISYNIIVLKHHGRLMVESKPGYTCFKIALPFQQTA
ncbi:MAG: Adaptive-response sensory-kinase SasA [Anaerolineae bacterium]|nr:Adaptive-response sensory-kinase SasA [Anaerolineae bacterium]